MQLLIRNQLKGETMVKATLQPNGFLVVTLAQQNSFPPAGSTPIRPGDSMEFTLAVDGRQGETIQ